MFRSSKMLWLLGVLLFFSGVAAGLGLRPQSVSRKPPGVRTVLENDRVLVNELFHEKESLRAAHIRPMDQVIIFLDEARYEVTHADGRKELRNRKAGDVIWHSQGEAAPDLLSNQPYRTVVVNIKQ